MSNDSWAKTDVPGIDDVLGARERLAGRIRKTPLVPSPSLSATANAPVFLKLEQLQTTGSFKLRGATNGILSLSPTERARGIVGVSTGNHGRGLAHAAKEADARCIICMSSLVPQNKVEGIQALGAEVRIIGQSQDDAQLEVDRLVAEEGMVMLPPFDHPDVIAGQGTLGLEVLEDLPEIETLVVPLSGGGLIAGVALAAKALKPTLRIVGVTMNRGPAMVESLKAGKPVPVKELPSLADALGGGIGLDNRYTFSMVRDLVDDTLLVGEAQIAQAIRHAYWEEKLVIEGSGAVGISTILSDQLEAPGVTALILSGCNIDMSLHQRIIAGEDVDVTAG
jgi:threonine dehydratase